MTELQFQKAWEFGTWGGVKNSWCWYLMGLEVTDESKGVVYMLKYTLTTPKIL